ncbi:MAG: hypothetical protein NTX76_06255 [Alphaproteobacteria bacterium]|nr:hypothetical protein [Alphaproteobacteria bacterium]
MKKILLMLFCCTSACGENGRTDPFHRVFSGPIKHLTVNNNNGRICIASGPECAATVTVSPERQACINEMNLVGETLKIEHAQTKSRGACNYEIMVPHHTEIGINTGQTQLLTIKDMGDITIDAGQMNALVADTRNIHINAGHADVNVNFSKIPDKAITIDYSAGRGQLSLTLPATMRVFSVRPTGERRS